MKKEIDPDLSAEELADLILEKPETTEQCGRDDWLKLTGDEWVRLLSELPQFADFFRPRLIVPEVVFQQRLQFLPVPENG